MSSYRGGVQPSVKDAVDKWRVLVFFKSAGFLVCLPWPLLLKVSKSMLEHSVILLLRLVSMDSLDSVAFFGRYLSIFLRLLLHGLHGLHAQCLLICRKMLHTDCEHRDFFHRHHHHYLFTLSFITLSAQGRALHSTNSLRRQYYSVLIGRWRTLCS